MTQETWTAVDNYYAGLLLPPDPTLDAVLQACDAADLPAIQVSPLQGKVLDVIARSIGARRILEIGTLGGYSTIWMARAMPEDGRVITLEADRKHAEVARANFARAGVADKVELRLGKALETLPGVAKDGLGPFDLVFIDANKSNMPEYFEWALKLSRRGSVIIADNVVRQGAILNAASDDVDVQGVRRFAEMLSAEKCVSATTVQTVGSKGYDGFTMAVATAAE